jgi:hypothetical protein
MTSTSSRSVLPFLPGQGLGQASHRHPPGALGIEFLRGQEGPAQRLVQAGAQGHHTARSACAATSSAMARPRSTTKDSGPMMTGDGTNNSLLQQGLNLVGQIGKAEWLLYEAGRVAEDAVVNDHVFRVAGHE